MYHNRFRGFTLIELLVVIAIIGILSAVVLASLNTARQKGNDAAIQSDLSTVQTQAEIFYGNDNSYKDSSGNSMCSADGTIKSALAGATSANGNVAVVCNVATDGSAYAASSPLVFKTGYYWCVDSTGLATSTKTALASGVTACP